MAAARAAGLMTSAVRAKVRGFGRCAAREDDSCFHFSYISVSYFHSNEFFPLYRQLFKPSLSREQRVSWQLIEAKRQVLPSASAEIAVLKLEEATEIIRD